MNEATERSRENRSTDEITALSPEDRAALGGLDAIGTYIVMLEKRAQDPLFAPTEAGRQVAAFAHELRGILTLARAVERRREAARSREKKPANRSRTERKRRA